MPPKGSRGNRTLGEHGPDRGRHSLRLVGDLAPGEPQRPVTRDGKQLVATAVALKRLPRLVNRAPVHFHHQPLSGPQEVGFEAEPVELDPVVDARRGKTEVPAQDKEQAFNLAPGQRDPRIELTENLAQAPRAAPTRGAGQQVVQGAAVEEAQHLGAGACPLDAVGGEHLRQVEQCTRDRRARDALPSRHVGGGEAGPPVHQDPRAGAAEPPSGGYVHPTAASIAQTPQDCGRPMREHGALPACEHRGHPAPLASERAVSHRVDAFVEAVQPAGADPAADGPGTEA
jgi:hypothetical protein